MLHVKPTSTLSILGLAIMTAACSSQTPLTPPKAVSTPVVSTPVASTPTTLTDATSTQADQDQEPTLPLPPAPSLATESASTNEAVGTIAATAPAQTDAIAASASEHFEAEPTASESVTPPRNRTIYFDFNHDGPNAAADRLLAQHAEFLQQHPQLRVHLHGHSDTQGDPLYNDHLAIQRALVIAERLEMLGVHSDQIEVFGWGSANPVDPVDAGRNRRVEFDYQADSALASVNSQAQSGHEPWPEYDQESAESASSADISINALSHQ